KFIDQIEKFIDEIKDKLFDKQHDTDYLLIEDLLHLSYKGQQLKKYKFKMQYKVQDVTENSNNDQINMLQDLEKK
ncbi:4273_t:CDS:2, partial [Cetraspora pellucida]